MGTNINDVYFCQFDRTDELSKRYFDRNVASKQMQPKYIGRPVSNRRTVMPVVDTVKKSSVKIGKFDKYNMKKDFHPGYTGPYDAYCDNVDVESTLFNRFMPLQKCAKNAFIPDSSSDLYNERIKKQSKRNPTFKHLQKSSKFSDFNPNSCNFCTNCCQ